MEGTDGADPLHERVCGGDAGQVLPAHSASQRPVQLRPGVAAAEVRGQAEHHVGGSHGHGTRGLAEEQPQGADGLRGAAGSGRQSAEAHHMAGRAAPPHLPPHNGGRVAEAEGKGSLEAGPVLTGQHVARGALNQVAQRLLAHALL